MNKKTMNQQGQSNDYQTEQQLLQGAYSSRLSTFVGQISNR